MCYAAVVAVASTTRTNPITRTYDDPCGIARALDLVGERWALLVVRELLLGPKRFTQLRRGLHDASANVLSQRLRELEAAGLVRRSKLGPPASTLVYELTDYGYQLEPVLLALGRWGSRTPMTSNAELSLDALMVALKTRFEPAAAADLRATFVFRLDDDQFRVGVRNGQLDIARGNAEQATASGKTDAATLRSLVFRGRPVAEAIASRDLIHEGDQR